MISVNWVFNGSSNDVCIFFQSKLKIVNHEEIEGAYKIRSNIFKREKKNVNLKI